MKMNPELQLICLHRGLKVMDARNQTAGCRVETFLHKASPPPCLIETNAQPALVWTSASVKTTQDFLQKPVSYLLLVLWDVCTF